MTCRALLQLVVSLLGWFASCAISAESAVPDVPVAAPQGAEGPYPPTAVGGYRPALDLEPGMVRAGPLTLSPIVSAAAGYDDNVALRSTDKITSSLYTLSPGVTATARNGPHRYYARYLGNYGRYASSERDDYEDHAAGLGANSDWSSRLRTQLRYDYFRGHDPRGATASAVSAPDRWATHAMRALVAYGAKGAKGNIEGEAGADTKRYATNRAVTAVRDYRHADVGAAFYYRMQPSVYTLVHVKAGRFDYDTNPSLDSTEMRYFGGVRWEATAKTQGSVRAGYMTKRFSEGSRPDASAYTYDASITWSPLTYSVVHLNGVRTFGEQTSGGNYILTDNGTLLWTHDWSSRVRSSLSYGHGRDVHEGLNRTDTRQNLGLKGTYAFRRTVRLGGEVRHEERRSDAPNLDYKRNVVLFTVEATL